MTALTLTTPVADLGAGPDDPAADSLFEAFAKWEAFFASVIAVLALKADTAALSVAQLGDVATALKAVLTAPDLGAARAALGLGNVANVAPADLPVSSATATAIATLGGQVSANAQALATILGGANPAIDTFIEVFNRFASDESAAAAMNAAIGALQSALTDEVTRARAAEQANATAIGNNATAIGGLAPKARQILAAGLATGGGDLSADRTVTVPKASAAMASAGTDDASAVTPLALAAPLAGKVGTGRQVLAAGLATGGGDLSADRTVTVPKASAAMASAGTDDASAVTPLALAAPLASKVGSGRQVATAAGGGLTGGGDLSADRTLSIAANGVANAMLAQAPALTLKANLLGSTANVTDVALSALLDAVLGSTRGAVLYRGTGAWAALAPGSVGQYLGTGGAGADPAWGTPAGAGNVATSGAPSAGQFALFASGSAIKGTASPSFRNRLINGNFSINQRGAASASTAWAAGAYVMDRWKAGANGCTLSFAAAASGDVTVTITAGTLVQVIEGALNLPEGGAYLLSWSGNATARVYQGAASGSYVAAPLAAAGLTAGTNVTVEFSTGTVGLVQFEPGTTATAFERRDDELRRCKRYYEFGYYGIIGNSIGGGAYVGAYITFKVDKRNASLQVTFINTGGGNTQYFNADNVTTFGFRVYVQGNQQSNDVEYVGTFAASNEL